MAYRTEDVAQRAYAAYAEDAGRSGETIPIRPVGDEGIATKVDLQGGFTYSVFVRKGPFVLNVRPSGSRPFSQESLNALREAVVARIPVAWVTLAVATPTSAAIENFAAVASPTPLPPTKTSTSVSPTRTPRPRTATPRPTPPTPTSTRPVAGATRVREKDGAVMLYVPAGEFIMGSREREGLDDEQPQHTVHVDDFWIDRTEVTNEQYRRCVDADACRASDYANYDRYNDPRQPVVGVDWPDARAYCQWLGEGTGQEYRLPTEAEWEKAARGTDGREYPWGDVFDGRTLNSCDVNCEFVWKDREADDGYQYTAPVGSYPAGASPYGALDMAGNVGEWCSTLYADYPYDPDDGREDLEAEGMRVVRGGSWGGYWGLARCASREGYVPDYWVGPGFGFDHVGFRVAASRLEPE